MGSAGSEGVGDIRLSSDNRNAFNHASNERPVIRLYNMLQATMEKYGFINRLIWLHVQFLQAENSTETPLDIE